MVFRFSLGAGENYSKQIGPLTLNITSNGGLEPPNGWTFSLDGEKGRDCIAPVNPPLRFNASQILGPGYGLSASESMQYARDLGFLLSDSDYDLIDPLWRNALWLYNAPDPDRAGDIYTRAIRDISLGRLQLKILRADIAPEGIIRSASFEATVTVPDSFPLDPALKPRRSSCPPK